MFAGWFRIVDQRHGRLPSPAESSSAEAPANPIIVRLVRRHDIITITAGSHMPLYTVAEDSGRVLVSEMSMPQLKTTRPDLYEQISPAVAPTAQAWAGE